MPNCKMFRYDRQGFFEAEDVTYSDKDVDFVHDSRPPEWHTWTPPPKYDPATEIPQYVKGEWRIVLLSDLATKEPTLEELKAARLAELEEAWGKCMARGYTSAVAGIQIACGPTDVMMWDLGQKIAAKQGKLDKVVDEKGQAHADIPAVLMNAVIDERNDWLYRLWLGKLAIRDAINAAATPEALEAISLEVSA